MSKEKLIKKEEKPEKSTGEPIRLDLPDEQLEHINGGRIPIGDKPCPYCGSNDGTHTKTCRRLLNQSHL